MIEVVILALALSMDAFAVSIGLGAKHPNKTSSLVINAGLYFGFFQGLMPLIGYLGGKEIFGWVQAYAPWIAFILLVLVGSKMIYESCSGNIGKDIVTITHKVMLVLAIATSIDALAAGFSLILLDVNAFVACAIIAVTTLVFSGVGVFVGVKSGTWFGSKAELFGGIVLILLGVKLLFV